MAGKNLLLRANVPKRVDPDSRQTGITPNAAVAAATRNGLNEVVMQIVK